MGSCRDRAFNLSADAVRYHYPSLGGLRVNADAQVIGAEGQPIGGLYAAGSCAAAIILMTEGYASGMTLANGSFVGRIARHAVIP